eukprot:scaffold201442_cov37-Prasinocladus_malaysianus.AAC.2
MRLHVYFPLKEDFKTTRQLSLVGIVEEPVGPLDGSPAGHGGLPAGLRAEKDPGGELVQEAHETGEVIPAGREAQGGHADPVLPGPRRGRGGGRVVVGHEQQGGHEVAQQAGEEPPAVHAASDRGGSDCAAGPLHGPPTACRHRPRTTV